MMGLSYSGIEPALRRLIVQIQESFFFLQL